MLFRVGSVRNPVTYKLHKTFHPMAIHFILNVCTICTMNYCRWSRRSPVWTLVCEHFCVLWDQPNQKKTRTHSIFIRFILSVVHRRFRVFNHFYRLRSLCLCLDSLRQIWKHDNFPHDQFTGNRLALNWRSFFPTYFVGFALHVGFDGNWFWNNFNSTRQKKLTKEKNSVLCLFAVNSMQE